jgi:hypothetical protein
LTVSGTQTILNSTVVNIEDNLLMLSAGQSTLGLDSGIMIDRYQVPNAGGTGDLVAGSGSLIQESGTTTGVGSTSTVVFAANASSTDDYYKDWWIMITSGSAANQVRKITSYVGSTKTATIYTTGTDGAAFTVTPGNGVTYNLYNAGNATMMYSSSTGQFNFLTNATSSDNGVLTTVTTSQQYTPLNSQAVTVKPLVFNNVSASVSSTTLTLSVAGNTPTVGDKIALSNLSGFTGTSVPTTVAYSVVSVSAPTFTITVPSGAITTNASVTVSFLESSVVYANKISLADSRYGQLSLGGVSFYTELVTIPASNTLGVLITNSRTYGLYQIFASDDNNTTGAKAVWTIAGTGSGGGATQMSSVQGTGTSTPSLKLIWSSATQIYLAHRSAASVNYTYKVVMLVF